jgi:hypothetical protein
MKLKFVTTLSDSTNQGWLKFEKSLKEYNWDYHGIVHPWTGYLSKITQTYEYLKTLKAEGYTHFIYSDSYDSLAFAGPQEVLDKMKNIDGIVMSVEKACYPYVDWANRFPETTTPWRFVNGGGWYADIDAYIAMVENDYPKTDLNDQVWSQRQYLDNNPNGLIQLDTECSVFQTYAFHSPDDFKFEAERIKNLKTGSYPVFFHFNGHTNADEVYKLKQPSFYSVEDVQAVWQDTRETHKLINESFQRSMERTPYLREHRDWVQKNIFGFGERSFHWMWKLIIDKMESSFSFLEVGVFRGQVLSLVQLLADNQAKQADIYGITPLTGADGHWESDYSRDIEQMHEAFNLGKRYNIIQGMSTDADIIEQAKQRSYDIVYIDGGHTYPVVKSDVAHYPNMVKPGGYLVIDDCANKYNMPFGYFQGIAPVSKAVDEVLPNSRFKELFNVVHNRVFQRIA